MNKLILGCDPDVDGKGFAIYEDGVLTGLRTFSLIELYHYLEVTAWDIDNIELHIEDLCSIKSSSFNHHRKDTQFVKFKKSESVGRCKQMQLEVEKVAGHFGIKIVRYKVSSRWKNATGKKEFEKATGWTGRSNEDTRSAAYFGFLGCK